MKYQSFCMRVLCLLLILAAVIGYNSMQKKDTQDQVTRELTQVEKRVDALEEQPKIRKMQTRRQRPAQKRIHQKKMQQTAKLQMLPKTSTKTVPTPVPHRDSAERSRFR